MITAAALAIALLIGPLGLDARASPSREAQDQPRRGDTSAQADSGMIRLIQQNTTVAADGDFTVFMDVQGAPDGSDLAVDIYPVIDDDTRLEDALAGTPRNSSATFPVVALPANNGSGPIQTGFVINLYSPGEQSPGGGWAKRLDEPGVYPVRVRLRGPDSSTLVSIVTFLVRDADDNDQEIEPTPIVLTPRVSFDVSPTRSIELAGTPLDDDQLNAVTALLETFDAHTDVPASFIVPAEVARRLQLSRPDDGEGTDDPDDGSEPGTGANPDTSTGGPGGDDQTDATGTGGRGTDGSDDAEQTTTSESRSADQPDATIAAFRATLSGNHRELIGSPFVDLDPAELVDAGLVSELTLQRTLGFRDLAAILEAPTGETWTASRPIDPETVDALGAAGVTNLLVPPSSIIGRAPALPFRLSGASSRSRALMVDPSLAIGGNDDPVLGAQRLFGHAIARSMINDGAPQLVSVPLPDSVEDIAELDGFLTTITDEAGFAEVTTLSDLLKSSSTATDRATLTPPDHDSAGSFPGALRSTRQLVDAYTSMIPHRPDLGVQLTDQLSLSATAGLPAKVRTDMVAQTRELVESRFAQVTIPSSDRVTLGARDAQFPLVISSESDVPLRVLVDVSSASDRLTVKQESTEVMLDSDRTVVPLEVHSRSPGDTPVHIKITTLDGSVILSEGTYSIRSTAVSGVGLLLTIGAGLFLALWWGRHFLRARRSKARHAR